MKKAGWEIALGVLGVAAMAMAQQTADPEFNPAIESPAFEAGQVPRVVIDAAHLNFHTADGGYAPFAELLRRVAAVEGWVRGGGSLLLIADHMPLAGHAEALAAVFGVRFSQRLHRRPLPKGTDHVPSLRRVADRQRRLQRTP